MGIRIALCALAVAALAGCSTPTNPAPGQAMSSARKPDSVHCVVGGRRSPQLTESRRPSTRSPGHRSVPAGCWPPGARSPATDPAPLRRINPTPKRSRPTLYLVDPQGGRYPITSFGPGRGSDFEVIDWSGDKSRALLRTNGMSANYVEVDLHTGKQTPLALQRLRRLPQLHTARRQGATGGRRRLPEAQDTGPHRPHGHASADVPHRAGLPGRPVHARRHPTRHRHLHRPRLHGQRRRARQGDPRRRPEGLRSDPVVGRRRDRRARGLRRQPVAAMAGAGRRHCTHRAHRAERRAEQNLGDVNAWNTPAGTFMQDLGACGVVYLAKLNPDGSTTKVDVPDLDGGSTIVVGVNGDSLRLQGRAACGGGIALADWNPSTNVTTFLLGGPLNGGGVTSAVAFKGQR